MRLTIFFNGFSKKNQVQGRDIGSKIKSFPVLVKEKRGLRTSQINLFNLLDLPELSLLPFFGLNEKTMILGRL